VVLVDDDHDSQEMYQAWLTHVGFAVFKASDAETGFRLALDHSAKIVITGHLLTSGPTGAELCRRLKQDRRTAHIPTLLLTGMSDRQTAEEALWAGCVVVRLKPYLPEAMVADIEAMLRGELLPPLSPEHNATLRN